MTGVTVSKYRIVGELGRGAMGIVFRAQDIYTGQSVALKIIAEKFLENREMVARFEREAMATAALPHANICAVFDAGNWEGRPYLAMELLEGIPLSERIHAGPVPVWELIPIATAAAAALAAAHGAGIVHRDIKPANIFLTSGGQVKVLDFGLAKMRPASPLAAIAATAATLATCVTMPGTLLGTLAYMSPEQVRGEPIDGRADLYSLGVTLHEAATGRLPVRGLNAPVQPELQAVINKLMEFDRAARYPDAASLQRDLTQIGTAAMSARACKRG